MKSIFLPYIVFSGATENGPNNLVIHSILTAIFALTAKLKHMPSMSSTYMSILPEAFARINARMIRVKTSKA